MSWKPSIKEIERLKQQGKIRGYNVGEAKQKPATKAQSIPRAAAPQVVWMKWNLWYWCNEKAVELKEEYQFDKNRLFRFDFYIEMRGIKCGLEFEGIFSKKSRHTNVMGYTTDTDKYSLAATHGIRVLRYTAINYKNVLTDLNKIFNQSAL
jgi:hypothetical protein